MRFDVEKYSLLCSEIHILRRLIQDWIKNTTCSSLSLSSKSSRHHEWESSSMRMYKLTRRLFVCRKIGFWSCLKSSITSDRFSAMTNPLYWNWADESKYRTWLRIPCQRLLRSELCRYPKIPKGGAVTIVIAVDFLKFLDLILLYAGRDAFFDSGALENRHRLWYCRMLYP